MNDILENKLSRSIAVEGFLRHFESVWSGNAVLGDCVTELEGLIDQVQAINARQVADASGYAIEKSNKREDMVSVGEKVIVSGIRTEEMITKADGMYEFGFGFEEGGSVRIKAMKAEYYDFVKFMDVKKGVVCEMDIEMEKVG